jgi:hypothetical protein
MKNVMFLFLIISISGCLNMHHKMYPMEWRAPLPNEVNQDWRLESQTGYLYVKGDFNGDGVMDEAKILINNRTNRLGLFVCLSYNEQKQKNILLDENNDLQAIEYMGIDYIAPGNYKTACGKGYWGCVNGETPEVEIKYSAINYFKTESANSFFYWEDSTREFKRIWISD